MGDQPDKDHLSDLSQRMRHFVSDVCTAREIAFRFRTPPPDHDIAVVANVRRDVFLIFKEAVNNMVRHSAARRPTWSSAQTHERLLLRISDNGRGFDVAAMPAGHGLRSMRERTRGLGGHLDVLSQLGRGTGTHGDDADHHDPAHGSRPFDVPPPRAVPA